jgi:hypothetical protein
MFAPGLTLAYRPDLGLVIARWQREVTPAELQRGYLAIRAVADEAQCDQWLLDLRRRNDIVEPVVNAWFGHDFVPSLRGRYGRPARLAFLVSPLRAPQSVALPAPTSAIDYQFATFTEEAPAYAWLTSN